MRHKYWLSLHSKVFEKAKCDRCHIEYMIVHAKTSISVVKSFVDDFMAGTDTGRTFKASEWRSLTLDGDDDWNSVSWN